MIDFSNVENGSKFVRADLHIHSFGFDSGSFDVSDKTMTPQNIVDTALEKGLKVISITDHNEIENSKIAIDYAKGKEILVIPGIEISTIQGHLLIYFETYENLKNFKGRLHINSNKETCSEGIINCLDLAKEFNGIGVLAHIELSSGFERTIGRFGPQIEDIFKHPNLFGLEITSKDSIDFFTDNDAEPKRKNLINIRRKELDLPNDYDLPKLMSSDSHKLEKLGLNASGDGRLTRIKMNELSFHAFKVALMTPIARIRLEDFIPEQIPHFIGMEFDGGILKDQVVHFSNNLTCIIGGRGTGKSTMLESICETSGNSRNARVVDSEVWSDKISLVYEDETGKKILLIREKNGEVVNMTDGNEEAMTNVPIEIYGQGETAETLQHSDSNPNVLLEFLDSFIDINSLKTEDEDFRNKLIENKSDIDKLRLEVKNIPETLKLKKDRESKIKRYEKEKVGDLVKHHSSLIQERALRSDLIEELKELIEKYKNIFSDKTIFEMVKDIDGDEILVGKDNFEEVKKIVAEFSDVVNATSEHLNAELTSKVERLRTQLKDWKSKEADIQKEIDKKKQELKKQGIPFDIGRINQISKDLVYYQKRLKKLLNDKKMLEEKLKDRKGLLFQRKETKGKIFYSRVALANELNKNLKNTIEGFFITIKYSQGTYSKQFEDHLRVVLDYRTSSVKKAHLLSRNVNPIEFSNALRKKDLVFLNQISDDGVKVFNDLEINRIISKYEDISQLEELESLEFEDLPSILVTKNYKDEVTGKPKHITKSLANLSLGQQQSILLAILLHSKSKNPLLIDQPEDNLDSEFVYKTIVSNLRKIKEQRQVIIVTHNPNIAVLGDAELIIPLKSSSTRSVIYNRGSIDNAKSKKISCAILEGGERAFRRRKEIYGI